MSTVRILLLWLALPSLEARQFSIRTFTSTDGLARDRIQCIVQDTRGFLWFCTPEGLSRFDGYRFTNYGTEQGLPSNNVSDFLETGDGIYWVGTPAGPCRFDATAAGAAKVRCYSLPADNQTVNVLRRDRNGGIWCGAHAGLFRLAKDGASFQREDLGRTPEEGTVSVHALLEDRRGRLWVGTGTGLYLTRRASRREPGLMSSVLSD